MNEEAQVLLELDRIVICDLKVPWNHAAKRISMRFISNTY